MFESGASHSKRPDPPDPDLSSAIHHCVGLVRPPDSDVAQLRINFHKTTRPVRLVGALEFAVLVV